MTQAWLAIKVGLGGELQSEDSPEADLASHLLFELGAEGLEWREGEHLEIVAAFRCEEAAAAQVLVAEVMTRLSEAEIPVDWVRSEPYADLDWASQWKLHFKPLRFSSISQDLTTPDPARDDSSIWLVPSWLEAPSGAQRVLRIDPSSAFGTGLHPTTALCIEWLIAEQPSSLLDVGTGTGVLALVAALLGAERVMGVDNDPEAVRVATENRALNGVSEAKFEVSGVELEAIEARFDVVMANILAEPLIDLAPSLVQRLALGGRVVLSGLLTHQASKVISAYAHLGLEPGEVKSRDDWALVSFRYH